MEEKLERERYEFYRQTFGAGQLFEQFNRECNEKYFCLFIVFTRFALGFILLKIYYACNRIYDLYELSFLPVLSTIKNFIIVVNLAIWRESGHL